MLPFVIRRLLIAIPLIVASSFLVFVMVANAGVPAQVENAELNPRVSEAQRSALRARFNLDEPVLARYWDWVTDAVRGDFGTDASGQEVLPQIRRAMGITLRLVVFALVVAVVIAILVGSISALRQYSIFDHATTFTFFLFFSLPVFWLAVLLKEFGAIRLNDFFGSTWLYTVGDKSVPQPSGFWSQMGDYAGHMILPALTLIVISCAQYSRFTRASMLETLNADYVRTARAKGVPRRRVVTRHALRNALIPVTTVVAIDFGAVLGGAIITERVFQWRGMGTLFIEALTGFDIYMIQGWLVVTAVLVVVFNLVADIMYAFLDPRIRL